MSTAVRTVRIARPAEDVFAFLADQTNNPRWQPLVTSSDTDAPGPAVGVRYRQRARHPLGYLVPVDVRIEELVAPLTLTYRVVAGGPIRPTGRYDLVAVAPALTQVTATIRSAVPLLHPWLRWEAGWIERAKTALEAPRLQGA